MSFVFIVEVAPSRHILICVHDLLTAHRRCEQWEELPTGLGLKTTWNILWTWSKPHIQYSSLLLWQKVRTRLLWIYRPAHRKSMSVDKNHDRQEINNLNSLIGENWLEGLTSNPSYTITELLQHPMPRLDVVTKMLCLEPRPHTVWSDSRRSNPPALASLEPFPS